MLKCFAWIPVCDVLLMNTSMQLCVNALSITEATFASFTDALYIMQWVWSKVLTEDLG